MAFRAVTAETRAAIADLDARWAWSIDTRDYAVLEEILTPDVRWVGHGGELTGRDAVIASYAERARRATRITRHGVGNRLLEQVDDDTVRGLSSWHNFADNEDPPGEPRVYLVADFRDVFVRDDRGDWRIAERVIEAVFRDDSLAPLGRPLIPGRRGEDT